MTKVLESVPMRRLALTLCLAAALPSFAQGRALFREGKEPLLFKEQDLDRKLMKSKLGKTLYEGTQDPNCVQLIGGLFMVLAEAAPFFHRRDENFLVPPELLQAVQTQLSVGSFNAGAYLLAMVRRVLIEKRLPDAWLALATEVNESVQIIDLGKLKMLNEGIQQVDSFMFSLPLLKARYIEEVVQANSAVTSDVASTFRDTYIDRQVTWSGATFIDAGLNKIKKRKKGQKGPTADPNAMEQMIAVLEWVPPDPNDREINFFRKPADKPVPIRIYARLKPRQYIDIERIPRGKRMMVKGRFWEMTQAVDEVEVRDALLFEDRDFTRGVILADPNAIARCPVAINELTGVAPQQPGGFRH